MKLKALCSTVFVLLLSVANLAASAAEPRIDLLGDPAPLVAAKRAITIDANTRYVNVVGGEIIQFVVGDKTFAWNFDGPLLVTSFELNRVAPAGLLDHQVIAYVAPNPLYRRGPPNRFP